MLEFFLNFKWQRYVFFFLFLCTFFSFSVKSLFKNIHIDLTHLEKSKHQLYLKPAILAADRACSGNRQRGPLAAPLHTTNKKIQIILPSSCYLLTRYSFRYLFVLRFSREYRDRYNVFMRYLAKIIANPLIHLITLKNEFEREFLS